MKKTVFSKIRSAQVFYSHPNYLYSEGHQKLAVRFFFTAFWKNFEKMLFSIGIPTVRKSKQNHGIILIPLTFRRSYSRFVLPVRKYRYQNIRVASFVDPPKCFNEASTKKCQWQFNYATQFNWNYFHALLSRVIQINSRLHCPIRLFKNGVDSPAAMVRVT